MRAGITILSPSSLAGGRPLTGAGLAPGGPRVGPGRGLPQKANDDASPAIGKTPSAHTGRRFNAAGYKAERGKRRVRAMAREADRADWMSGPQSIPDARRSDAASIGSAYGIAHNRDIGIA